jgi:RNA polymerase sigma factor (sigma-70 family)
MTCGSQKLLADFVKNGSEAAFRQLVERYTDLVYATSFRMAEGDMPLAQDVTQTVFLDLARMASKLSGELMLGGWLHRHTCFVCSSALRAERRRRKRERQAAEMSTQQTEPGTRLDEIGPILDEAINQLNEADRKAILFRFFEQASFRTVGEALCINEDAARMRVSRALEKLHLILRKRGFAGSGMALGTLLAGSAAMTAPLGLAATLSSSVLTGLSSGNSTVTLLKIITMTKLKTSIVGALLLAGIAVSMKMHHQAQAKLQAQSLIMEQQSVELDRLNSENAGLSNLVFQANALRQQEPSRELLKLRGEVGVLRAQLAASAKHQSPRTELLVQADQQQGAGGPYHAAETWTNLGYQDPQSAAITFFWALRNRDQAVYSGAFGRNMPEPEDVWVDAYNSVKGSFLSDPLSLPNGDVQVSVAHEIANGEIVNTLITYRQENGQWLIGSMAGYPVPGQNPQQIPREPLSPLSSAP